MVGIVLASHGDLAAGIKQTASMVFGDQPDVVSVSLQPSMGPDDLRAEIEKEVATLSDSEQVLFLVDLWGGTPFNQINGLLDGHPTWAAVTGMNLPMVITAYTLRMNPEATAHEIAAGVLADSRDGVRVKPEDLEPEPAAAPAAAAPVATAAAIPEGTVLGDGHIKIAHCRVDTRLLHGQVATTWTKQVSPDRILVVSDAVSHDELRKTMIVQAAPPGVKVHVIPIEKMIEVSKDPRFGATKVMLLFETPQDVLKAVEGGVDIKNVNLGSMAHSVGKVVVTNAIAMDQADVECLETLASKGIEFDVRKVPADSPENFDAMMKKAKSELAAQA
ncbi:PTS sugar transporter subunit IIB [Enorma phocaeensis]|uniref:PTS system mannose-specific EIIAB component n=1 Tax=Enorma phocaeensis TaxID=1871019 RepID=A0A921IVW3_9ACTN|nr:PTS sugar transporter subunit IIB [Enorma phocaeensis]HJG36997.1 PTS sugar transporter subunit IIB [Enorma phocaeensis]